MEPTEFYLLSMGACVLFAVDAALAFELLLWRMSGRWGVAPNALVVGR